MSIDLSNIIKETIESTLETNLSHLCIVNEISKTKNESLKDKNIVIANTLFTFETKSINLKFIIPAFTASYLFNKIMMEENSPSLEIDDDIADALKEIISQILGTLETSINALEENELGKVKISLDNINIDSSKQYNNCINLTKLNIKLEEFNLEIYIDINDESFEYFEIFKNSPEEELIDIEDDENNNQNLEEESEDIEDAENNNINTDELENQNNEKEYVKEKEEQNNENNENAKNKNIKLLIIIISSLLFLIIITFAILFFIGFFDKKASINKDINKTKLSKREIFLNDIKHKDINFSMNMIDVKKLNKRLSLLTKYEILEENLLKEYKKLEKERLYKLKIQRLEEFANQNQEEQVLKKDLIKISKNKNRFENKSVNIQNNIDNNLKQTFIQIDALSYTKYKSFISKEITKQTRISICKDENNKTYIYIGPMYLNVVINNILNHIKSNVNLISINKIQFNKQCSF